MPVSPDLAQLEAIAALLSEGLVIVSQSGAVLLAGAPALALLGLPAGASPAAVAAMLAAEVRLLERCTRERFRAAPCSLPGPRGDLRLLADGGPVEIGGAHCGVLVLRRLEPGRAAHDELRRLEELREDILAIASHELKNPLTVVLGYGTLIASDPEVQAKPRLARAAASLIQQSRRMRRLLDLLLDFSRLGLGRLTLHTAEVNLADLLGDVVERQRAATPDLDLRLRADAGALRVWGDPVRLEQVAGLLLAGAMCYTPSGERIDITLRRAAPDLLPEAARHVAAGGGCALLQIVDAGLAAEDDVRRDLFASAPRPSRTDSALAEQWLGMYVCARLVALHGGALWFERGEERRGIVNCALPLER